MDGILKKIFIMFLIFGVLEIGFEVFRFYNLNQMFQDDIQAAATDSVELAMQDDYRHDKISLIDESACVQMFYTIIRDKYHLDASLVPERDSFIQGKVYITKLKTVQGTYHVDSSDSLVIDKEPSFEIEGYINVKPLALGSSAVFKLPFKAKSENKRYESF